MATKNTTTKKATKPATKKSTASKTVAKKTTKAPAKKTVAKTTTKPVEKTVAVKKVAKKKSMADIYNTNVSILLAMAIEAMILLLAYLIIMSAA